MNPAERERLLKLGRQEFALEILDWVAHYGSNPHRRPLSDLVQLCKKEAA